MRRYNSSRKYSFYAYDLCENGVPDFELSPTGRHENPFSTKLKSARVDSLFPREAVVSKGYVLEGGKRPIAVLKINGRKKVFVGPVGCDNFVVRLFYHFLDRSDHKKFGMLGFGDILFSYDAYSKWKAVIMPLISSTENSCSEIFLDRKLTDELKKALDVLSFEYRWIKR